MATEAHCTGGLFSVALSVAGNLASLARIARRVGPLALPGALPFSLRRPPPKTLVLALCAKTFVPGERRENYGVRTFLPARLLAKASPAITRPARHAQYIISQRSPAQRMAPKITQKRLLAGPLTSLGGRIRPLCGYFQCVI